MLLGVTPKMNLEAKYIVCIVTNVVCAEWPARLGVKLYWGDWLTILIVWCC